MLAQWAVGIDLGGTNLKVGLVDSEGRVGASTSCPTRPEKGPAHFLQTVDAAVDALFRDVANSRSGSLVAAGLGAPGPLNLKEGLLIKAANLPGWINVPLREQLARQLRVPVVLENDANAAAFGEFVGQRLSEGKFWQKPNQSWPNMVLLTLGTGVGAGVILDGKVLHGHFDNAGELGHMIAVANGLACPCGQRGCLEAYASAGAITRRFRQAGEAGEPSTLPLDSDAKAIALGAERGDVLCRKIWDEACFYLAIACINIQHAFNPEVVLLGGGVAEAGEFLVSAVRRHLDANRWQLHDDIPQLELARLGSTAGVVGTAALAWAQFTGADEGRS